MRVLGSIVIASLAACGDSARTEDQIDAPVGSDAAADAEVPVDALITTPPCTTVTGTSSVTFTHDEGATFATTTPLTGTSYVYGLVGTTRPGELIAAVDANVLRSHDAGCTWSRIGAVDAPDAEFVTLVSGKDGHTYGFGDNRQFVLSVDDSVTTHLTDWGVVGLGPDGIDGHFRVVDAEHGQIRRTEDNGATWARVGEPSVGPGTLVYRAAFDPKDASHVLIGTSGAGLRFTRDNGTTWVASSGLPKGSNVFSVVFSDASQYVVWAEALNTADASRSLYRSTDGGESFTPVLDESRGPVLINGNRLAPHPTDGNVLYFTYGTSYMNYGTDVYRYDVSTDTLTTAHHPAHRAEAVAFPPWNPEMMYLGLSHENVN